MTKNHNKIVFVQDLSEILLSCGLEMSDDLEIIHIQTMQEMYSIIDVFEKNRDLIKNIEENDEEEDFEVVLDFTKHNSSEDVFNNKKVNIIDVNLRTSIKKYEI